MTEPGSYKNTVNLPKTKFDMRANAVKREPELQQFWADQQIYQRLSQNNPGDLFILHDGPPYANGSLHIGHALNKILKDIINRYQLLQGRKVRYVPGWDCHGLPIELKVLQQMKPEERANLTPLELRRKAREFALKTVEEQRQDFERYGVWGDWEHPYLTLTPEYEAAQVGVFGQMVLKGYIYRGRKPVHWSPSSKTALAEAELEYPDGHVSRSLYAAFPITGLADAVRFLLEPYWSQLGVAIWTTTPWTIPANLAVSVNPELNYAVVELGADFRPITNKYLLVAADLVERLSATLGTSLTVKVTMPGKMLEHCTYRHPLYNRESPIVIGGDYVTADSGTGLVHTAPGHGDDDYKVGMRYGLPLLSPVDEDGNFTAEAEQFAGLNVLGDGNEAVIQALIDAGALLKEEPYAHTYPYDWRTKKPTIYRATEQWFASVEGFREEALKAIASVNWIPAQGENRITAMVSERSDWCISRQRCWGVPIPVFYDEETGEPLLTEETIAHVQAIFAEKGSDAWWELSVAELLPEAYRHNGRSYRKGNDTMDVWFDSGSSWAAVAETRPELRYPADMYLEGSDQHRGWFQSSLLTSVANNGIAPYKTVLTHGFVLDENNRKMSKSLGNVVDPTIAIEGGKNQQQDPPYGADVLRLWVSSVDYSSDVPLGKNILKQLGEVRNKIRNTARFLLGNLHDFDPAKDAVPYEQLPDLDRYMLHRMTEVFGEVTTAFENYQFFHFFQVVQNFCVVDLSNFYLDVAKDRLYISAADSFRRRSCQTVLAVAVENLARAIAPVLCHMAEDIWQYLPYPTPYKSVFEAGWVRIEERWQNPELAASWEHWRQIRGEVNKVLERARAEKMIGSSLEAKVLLYVPDEQLQLQLAALNPSIGHGEDVSQLPISQPPSSEISNEDPWTEEAKPEVEVKVRSRHLPTDSAPKAIHLQQLQEFWKPVSRNLSVALNYVSQLFKEYKRPSAAVSLILVAIVTLYLIQSVVSGINQIPLLESFFEAVGLGVVGWFVFHYLVTVDKRQELSGKIKSLKEEILGKADSLEISQATPQPVIQVETQIEPPNRSQVKVAQIPQTNGVDELRYLFLTSEVELLESAEALEGLQYSSKLEELSIGVVKAEGKKCDRCWNYSVEVGKSTEHPLLCNRCIPALAGKF